MKYVIQLQQNEIRKQGQKEFWETHKYVEMNTFLTTGSIKCRIAREIRKYLEMNEEEDIIY